MRFGSVSFGFAEYFESTYMSTKPGGNVSKFVGLAMVAALLLMTACASGKTIKQGYESFSVSESRYYEALSYQDDGNYFEAIQAWAEILEDEPRFAQGHFNLGLVYDHLNMVPEAIEHYELALRWAEETNKPDGSSAQREENQADTTASLGLYNLHLGAAYLRSGLIEEGLDALLKSHEIDPFNPTVHYNLSAAYLARSNFDDALTHADIAVDLYAKPDSKRTDNLAPEVDRMRLGAYLLRQARCHIEREEWAKAKETLDRAKKQCSIDTPRDMAAKIKAADEAAAKAAEESASEEG